MFTFDVFLVYHSLGNWVTGIALFIFWVIPQEFKAFHITFYKIQNISMLNMFTFDVFYLFHLLGQSVMGIIDLFIF